MKTLRVLDDIRRLFSSKADNLSYNNGQLQLTADNKPIGLPLSIVTGGSINSFVSGVNNGIFIAPTNDVSTFTITDYQSSKIVTLIKENYVLVQNKDFSIDNTGLVTLSYPLEKDQFVAWIMMHTTYDYNDLANKPEIGSGGVSLKISETEPSTELVSGLVWYRPSTRSLAMYIENTGFIKLNSSEGEVQMFEQVFTAVAPTGVIDITIPDLNVRDVLLVDHDGATLYEGINYSVNYTESKLNLLAHELKIGESIHIVCIRVSNGSTAVLDKAESIYTAQEAGITVVPINIIGFDTSQIYIVDHDGAILHEGVNYEVLPDMKNIQLLNFAMEAGERIHILNIKMISSEATKAMLDDMRDKVTDVITKVDAKIDIVDIINDTTSGGADKVLSAEQGKLIDNRVTSAISSLTTISSEVVNSRESSARNHTFSSLDERLESIDVDLAKPVYSEMSTLTGYNYIELNPANTTIINGSIVGNSLYNTIKNSSLGLGTFSYSILDGTLTAPNNDMLRAIGNGTNFSIIVYQQLATSSKKWYVKLRVRATANCSRIHVYIGDAINAVVSTNAEYSINMPVVNQWYDVSEIFELDSVSQIGAHRLIIKTEYLSAAETTGVGFEVNKGILLSPLDNTSYMTYSASKLSKIAMNVIDKIMYVGSCRIRSIGENVYDGKLYAGGINLTTGTDEVTVNYYRSGYIRVKPDRHYYHNILNGNPKFTFYDIYKNFVSIGSNDLAQIPSNVHYIRFMYDSNALNSDIMINSGSVVLPYKPYKAHDVYMTRELYRLPNGVYDEFSLDGVYTKRMSEIRDQTGVVNFGDMRPGGSFLAILDDDTIQIGVKGDTLSGFASIVYYELLSPIVENVSINNGLVIEKGGSLFIDPIYKNVGKYDAIDGVQFGHNYHYNSGWNYGYALYSAKKLDRVLLFNKFDGSLMDITDSCTLSAGNNGFTSAIYNDTSNVMQYEITVDDNHMYPDIKYVITSNLSGSISEANSAISKIDDSIELRNMLNILKIRELEHTMDRAVLNDRTINSKPLSSNISLTASDVNAYSKAETYTQTQVNNLLSPKMNTSGGTFTGVATAQNNTAYTTKQIRNITLSTDDPSGGANGDIWIKYV